MNAFFGLIGKFEFSCNYKAVSSTNAVTQSVKNRRKGTEIEQYVSWDNTFLVNFYTNEQFTTRMSPLSLIVGKRFYLEVEWTEQFISSFPVDFHLTQCTVVGDDTTMRFDIVKQGCVSDLVQVTGHKGPYSLDNIRLSYKSFSFGRRVIGAFYMSLTCEIGLCLKTDKDAKTCGIDADNCPSGYSQGFV